MKRLDELIGIINGVNYDGVINEQEVEGLTFWIQENRDIDDPELQEAVHLLEDILEDSIVTEDERIQLIQFATKHQSDTSDAYRNYFILNGIIEGIASDQIINYDEAQNLRNWLAENSSLKGRKAYDRTRRLLEDVLEDDVITEEEHAALLSTFHEITNDFKSNSRIDMMRRKIGRRENVGLDIIEFIDDKDLIDRIHFESQFELEKIMRGFAQTSGNGTQGVFLSLAVISLLSYDGSFYPHVREAYSRLYANHSPQRIEAVLREIVDRFKPYDLEVGRRIINYVLMNALVPKAFLADFFVFLFDIYRLNFGYTLTDTIYDDLVFVYNGLKDKLSDDSDELALNVTKKTYKLTKATKCVIQSEAGRESIIRLSERLLKLIESSYWNDTIPEIDNTYIRFGYEGWQASLEDKERTGRKRKEEATRARWTPSFSFSQNGVILSPPVHNIQGVEDYSKLFVRVFAGDDLIHEERMPEIYEIIGGYQMRPKAVPIEDPLADIRYVVVDGDKTIYDSKDRLFRNYLLFSEDGSERKNNRSYKGTIYVLHNDENIELGVSQKTPHYLISVASDVTESTVFYIGDEVISFTEQVKPGLNGSICPNQYIESQSGEYIPVYNRVRSLSFETSLEANEIGIKINEKRIRLEELPYQEKYHGEQIRYIVDLDIEETGVYKVSAFQIRDDRTLKAASFRVLVDPGFSVETMQIGESGYIVGVNSSIVDSVSYQLNDETIAELKIPAVIDEAAYQYLIDAGVPVYKIDAKPWHGFYGDMWIGDFASTSTLELRGSELTSVRIKDAHDVMLDEIALHQEGQSYVGQIGSVISYENEYDYVVLEICDQDGPVRRINCYNKCVLDMDYTYAQVDPVTGTIDVQYAYHGKGNVGYQLVAITGAVLLENENLAPEGNVCIDCIEPMRYYYLLFYEVASGFTLEPTRQMGPVPLFAYSFDDMNGKTFKIPYVEYEDTLTDPDKPVADKWDLYETYVRLTRHMANGIFEGQLLRKVDMSMLPIKDAEHVRIEYLSGMKTNMIEAEIKTQTSHELFVDLKRYTICAEHDLRNTAHVFTYAIDLKGTV